MKTKLIIITLLALAVGGTCPSDVNNDGSVGIQDFLQVLGDWGPCPNATVVAAAEADLPGGPNLAIQLWSDNTIRFRLTNVGHSCVFCDESFPTLTDGWITMDSPAYTIAPAAIVIHPGNLEIWIHYADGAAYRTEYNLDFDPGPCANGASPAACEFFWLPWEEVK